MQRHIIYREWEVTGIATDDINELKSIIRELKNSENDVEGLKQEIKDKGLEADVNDFGKKYGPQIKKFMQDVDGKNGMSDEEKARMVMRLQEKMTPEQQKQFKKVVGTLKNYLKNKK